MFASGVLQSLPDVVTLARLLIGASLMIRGSGGVITETEAYAADDPASHSFCGLTPRNAVMFGPGGRAYIYRSYGLHLCLNVVGRPGEAVLLRAILPLYGIEAMRQRRPKDPLCTGPGRLGQALGLSMADNGRRFDSPDFALHLQPVPSELLLSGPRIGISRAIAQPWRFGLMGAPLSKPFPKQQP